MFAKGARDPLSRVLAVAKVMKQQKPPMYARAIQGDGAQSELLNATHLVNLSLGVAVAYPIGDAAELVRTYREMAPIRLDVTRISHKTNGAIATTYSPPMEFGWLFSLTSQYGPTLGARLEGLLEAIQDPENGREEGLRQRLENQGLTLTLGVNPDYRWASFGVTIWLAGDTLVSQTEEERYGPTQDGLALGDSKTSLIERIVRIPFAALAVAADILRASHEAGASPPRKRTGRRGTTPNGQHNPSPSVHEQREQSGTLTPPDYSASPAGRNVRGRTEPSTKESVPHDIPPENPARARGPRTGEATGATHARRAAKNP